MQKNFRTHLLSWAGCGGLLALASPAQAQTPTFAPAVVYAMATSYQPHNVAIADLNGDNNPDLLVTTANVSGTGFNSAVGVLLGNGDGTFRAATYYSVVDANTSNTFSNPYGIAVADVNKDGKLDVLTANIGTGKVGVLLGNGDGTLRAATTYFASTGPNNGFGNSTYTNDLAVVDVNNDGKLDVLAVNEYTTNTAVVLLGNGDGTFVATTSYSTGSGFNGSAPMLAAADVNADGKPDLVLALTNAQKVGVMLGTGNGTFQQMVTYPTGADDVAIADVNGDGKPDILTAGYNSKATGVLLGNGDGTFQAVATYATGTSSSPASLAVADVNSDGQLDLLTANIDQTTAKVQLGTGNGTFQTPTTYATGGGRPVYIAAGDVNGDGKADLITANQPITNNSSNTGTGTVSVLLTTTGSTIPSPALLRVDPSSGPVGTSVTLTGTNLTGATGVSFNGTAATTFAVVNSTTITATVPTGASTGNVTVTTPNGTTGGVAFTVTAPDLVVTTTTTIAAGTYNSITVNAPGVGTLAGNVTVTGSVTVNSGATLNDGCAVISGAGSFTLAAGGTLGICAAQGIAASGASGAVQTTGARSFATDASYVYNGTAAQNTGSGLPALVRNLTTTNANAVTLTAATSVSQVLTVGAAGNLVLNGNALTLLSNSAGTALAVNSSTGIVSGGTAVVQRYIDGSLNSGRGYRHYSVPVTGTTLADFATSGFTPVLNSAYNSSATPATVTPFPTLYIYNQSALASASNNLSAFDKGWLSPGSLNDGATPGIGYCVNISAGQLVDFVGTLYNSPLTVGMSRTTGATAADGGWALLGNPYPAPLDLSLVQDADRPNLDAALYVVQSTGPYAGGYRAYVNGVSTSATNSPLLAMGQGFFARVSAGQTSGSFTFRNAQRVTSYANQAAFQRTAADPRPTVRLELAGAGLADGWVTYVATGATPAFDSQLDAGKLPNSTGLNLSSVAGAANLAIDGRAAFTPATVLPLAVGVPAAGTYTLAATALNNLPTGLDAYLRDAQTGQVTKLSAGTSYAFSVTTAEAQALLAGRFTLQFTAAGPLATAAALTAAAVTVYPNPARESFTVVVPAVAGASHVTAELRNTLGQVVRQQAAGLPAAGARLTVPTAALAPGVYVLRLQAGSSTLAQRVVIQ